MEKENELKDYLIAKRQKYIDAELKHYRIKKEKSKTLRSKISVLDEILNDLNLNNR